MNRHPAFISIHASLQCVIASQIIISKAAKATVIPIHRVPFSAPIAMMSFRSPIPKRLLAPIINKTMSNNIRSRPISVPIVQAYIMPNNIAGNVRKFGIFLVLMSQIAASAATTNEITIVIQFICHRSFTGLFLRRRHYFHSLRCQSRQSSLLLH